MPPKKGGGGGGGGGGAAPPTKSFDVTVTPVFSADKLENFLAVVIPFISKTKIGKGITGKNDKESKQPQVHQVDLHADGKNVKMKMPAKTLDTGMTFTVTISHPPKDLDSQIAAGRKALMDMDSEKEKMDVVVESQLASINAKIEEKKVPKNSWMHKAGGARAQQSGGEDGANIGHTFVPE
eukprot:TRINITY_DN1254_c6_g3_i1.p3 TRINITY_DN1254_c6_g3~~TRINITY_DN1254_c6_g3_i1.p3  ORF type:complete len:181 (+),score=82.24 TRINITY_DN1254_c6_g3_i1:60-602(+)